MSQSKHNLNATNVQRWQLSPRQTDTILGLELVHTWLLQAESLPIPSVHTQDLHAIPVVQAEGTESDHQGPLKSEHEFDQLVENKRRHRKSCQNIIESEKELLKEQIRIAVANRIKQLHNLKLRLSIEVDQAYEDTLETKTLFDDYLAKGQGYLDKLKNLTDNK